MSDFATTDRLISSLAGAERLRMERRAEARSLDRAADRVLAELELMNLRRVIELPEAARVEMSELFGPLLSRALRHNLASADVAEALEIMFLVQETLQRRRIRFDRAVPACERKDWSDTA